MPAILPFYHIYGLVMVLIRGLTKGCKVVSLHKLESEVFLSVLKEHKVTNRATQLLFRERNFKRVHTVWILIAGHVVVRSAAHNFAVGPK